MTYGFSTHSTRRRAPKRTPLYSAYRNVKLTFFLTSRKIVVRTFTAVGEGLPPRGNGGTSPNTSPIPRAFPQQFCELTLKIDEESRGSVGARSGFEGPCRATPFGTARGGPCQVPRAVPPTFRLIDNGDTNREYKGTRNMFYSSGMYNLQEFQEDGPPSCLLSPISATYHF